MTDLRPNSIQFCHKQTLFGIVLMVRDSEPSGSPGCWEWSKWRKANFAEYEIYMGHT